MVGLGKHQKGDIKSTRGSPLWMAPERIVNKIVKEKELMEDLKTEVEAYKKRVGVCFFNTYHFRVFFFTILSNTNVDSWRAVESKKNHSLSCPRKVMSILSELCFGKC